MSIYQLFDFSPGVVLLVMIWTYLPIYYGLNRLFRMPVGR